MLLHHNFIRDGADDGKDRMGTLFDANGDKCVQPSDVELTTCKYCMHTKCELSIVLIYSGTIFLSLKSIPSRLMIAIA